MSPFQAVARLSCSKLNETVHSSLFMSTFCLELMGGSSLGKQTNHVIGKRGSRPRVFLQQHPQFGVISKLRISKTRSLELCGRWKNMTSVNISIPWSAMSHSAFLLQAAWGVKTLSILLSQS